MKNYRVSDGVAVEYYEAESMDAAAKIWIDTGDWHEASATYWVEFMVTEIVLDEDGDEIKDAPSCPYCIAVDPTAPECVDGEAHEWCSPHELLGGLRDDPGVRGNDGGLIAKEVCRHCGCYRVSDTWATIPQSGATACSTEYLPADEESLAWVSKQAAE